MGEKKWLLLPGHVTSKRDGDLHLISATRLAKLYGVPMADCIVVTQEELSRWRGPRPPILAPRYDGDYTLPAPKGGD